MENDSLPRRKFIKKIVTGLSGFLVALLRPFQTKVLGLGLNSDNFNAVITKMPQYMLGSPVFVKEGFGAFRIPISAMHKVGPLDEGIIVKICKEKGNTRFLTVSVKILSMENNKAIVIEKSTDPQPMSNLQPTNIIFDDLSNTLKRLNQINHKEVQSRFYIVGRR